ncbi:MAG TPA: nucleotide disphospho-sugar-binding domain-containing protein [Cytophagales bacterium]
MTPKKILFASIAFDGHFNPLTGMAAHLKSLGYDVRWYTGNGYADKLRRLDIPHFPFRQAREITGHNLHEVFPELTRIRSQVGKLQFSMKHLFVGQTEDHFADIQAIHRDFPFDVLVSDMLFTASLLVKARLNVTLVGVGISPLSSTSVDLPPPGLGLPPAEGFVGRRKAAFLRFVTKNVIFREANRAYNEILRRYGVAPVAGVFVDALIGRSDRYLQSGVPGFEYRRRDLGANIRFVGALLPRSTRQAQPFRHEAKLKAYKKVILVTQGTAEPDMSKLVIPTLEAFKDSDYLVVATTAGSRTGELRDRYPQANLVIEDFVDFNYLMPYADVYVTNGGYGGVMLALTHQLPVVAAGVHEAKNEITARVGYFKVGIDLKTERPAPGQVRQSVAAVLTDPTYRENVTRLSKELARYDANALCAKYFAEVLGQPEAVAAPSGAITQVAATQ